MPVDFAGVNPVLEEQDNTIDETAIDAAEAAIVTWCNTNTPTGVTVNEKGELTTVTARGGLLTAGNAYRINELMIPLKTVLMHIAHNGSSKATRYKNKTILLATRGTTAGETISYAVIIKLLNENGVTARMYLRCYAQYVYQYAKDNHIEFRVGKKAGIDSKYGYCGFDAAIYANNLNTHERAAADSVFQIAIARSLGGEQRVSNAVELTKGVIGSSSKTIMF